MTLFRNLCLALALLVPASAQAQALIAEYRAHIGVQDLHNSAGVRLGEAWQVLRQDRANYHRFNIWDTQDEWDPVFARFDARARFEQLIRNGRIDPAAARAILRGGAMVHVQVYGRGGQPQSVIVQLLR